MNYHFNNLAFERNPFVNPQMREHTLIVNATYARKFNSQVNWFLQTRQATTQTLTWMPAPCANLTKQNWSNSLPFQQFQALLTLFSKSFAFLHGTCSLSGSNIYEAWDEVYHPLCAPLPRNVTLRVHTVRAGLQMTDRTLTSLVTFSKGFAFAPALALHHVITGQGWKAWISMLSLSQFIRHYWGNTILFLFLRLLVCLNSAGSLA